MSEIKTKIVKRASELFDVHPRDIAGGARYKFIMPARFAVWKALKDRGWSYVRIGRMFDRDHSTILHGVRKANYLAERDFTYAQQIEELTNMRFVTSAITQEELEEQLAALKRASGVEELVND